MLWAIKITISTVFIAVLIWSVDWRDIYGQFQAIRPMPAAVAVSLLCLQYVTSAWKWQQSLKLHNVDYPLGFLLRVLCIAFFFNNFLPSAIGGDAYRAYRTFEHAQRPAHPISAIIVERGIGLIALAVLGYLSVVVLVANGTLPYKTELIGVSLATAVFAFLLLFAWRARYIAKIERRLHRFGKLEPLLESVRVIRRNKRYLWGLVVKSLLFQAIAIAAIAALFAALALPGKIFESGFTAAAAGVAGMIPLSINGIGVVEGSFAIAAVLANLPYGESVLVALFLRVFGLVSSIFFGFLYLFDRDRRRVLDREKSA